MVFINPVNNFRQAPKWVGVHTLAYSLRDMCQVSKYKMYNVRPPQFCSIHGCSRVTFPNPFHRPVSGRHRYRRYDIRKIPHPEPEYLHPIE
ncbi:MAG TPA: hypothetical protein PKC30_16000 [Saprospiraceae bacterium]|nr:hypothetical protein [Saprospiraceae bacterium]